MEVGGEGGTYRIGTWFFFFSSRVRVRVSLGSSISFSLPTHHSSSSVLLFCPVGPADGQRSHPFREGRSWDSLSLLRSWFSGRGMVLLPWFVVTAACLHGIGIMARLVHMLVRFVFFYGVSFLGGSIGVPVEFKLVASWLMLPRLFFFFLTTSLTSPVLPCYGVLWSF